MNVRVFAPAKINLTLRVGAPRTDGLHPLQSVVMFADIGDWIEAEPAKGLSLDLHGEFGAALGCGEDNLVVQAARALAVEAAVGSPAAHLRLEKNLPIASGMGGGSSDAAAALKALNVVWGLGLTEVELMRVAARVGADAPVCVAARSAWMNGIGEIVGDMQAPPLAAVLVNPLKPLATAAVFREFDRAGRTSDLIGANAPCWTSVTDVIAGVRSAGNDLIEAACALAPEVSEILNVLHADRRVACASMSGSGATLFALVENMSDATALALEITNAHPEWWARATTLGAA